MIKKMRGRKPLIHCITNPISINQCANAVLALGGRPIMAEHPCEVAEITKTADALFLNIGNITDARMKSIQISAETALLNGVPFVFDAVGVACSDMRRKYALELIEKYPPAVLKGNYSEIVALLNTEYKSEGVDFDFKFTVEETSKTAVSLAKRFNLTVIASGETDIVTDGTEIFHIKNGTPQLSHVTGTGCMLGVICACFLPFENAALSSVKACATLGVCGELSETEMGNGSFSVNLIDNLSTITDETVNKYLNLEEFPVEEF